MKKITAVIVWLILTTTPAFADWVDQAISDARNDNYSLAAKTVKNHDLSFKAADRFAAAGQVRLAQIIWGRIAQYDYDNPKNRAKANYLYGMSELREGNSNYAVRYFTDAISIDNKYRKKVVAALNKALSNKTSAGNFRVADAIKTNIRKFGGKISIDTSGEALSQGKKALETGRISIAKELLSYVIKNGNYTQRQSAAEKLSNTLEGVEFSYKTDKERNFICKQIKLLVTDKRYEDVCFWGEDRVEKGERLEKEGNKDGAVKCYKKGIVVGITHEPEIEKMCSFFYDNQDYETAKIICEKELGCSTGEKSLKASLRLAKIYDKEKNFKEASYHYNRIQFQRSYWAYLAAKFFLECPDEKYRDLDKALSIAKGACEWSKWKTPEYIHTLAKVYYEKGDTKNAAKYGEKAVKRLHELIKKDPENYGAHLWLAWLAGSSKIPVVRNGSLAMKMANKSIDLASKKNENLGWSYCCLASAYAELGDFEKAVLVQKKAITVADTEDKESFNEYLAFFQKKEALRK